MFVKKLFLMVLFSLQIFTTTYAQVEHKDEKVKSAPHLILHFDVNNTLIAQDKSSQKNVHDAISSCIADRVKGIWDRMISEPISYSQYIKHHRVKNPNFSDELKKKQDEMISNVLTVLKKQDHPQFDEMQNLYENAIQVLEKQESYIFNSFYKLLDNLDDRGIKYTIAIRTFGSDLNDIVDELNQRCGLDFIRIQNVRDKKALYEALQKGHVAVREDYHRWFDHGKKWQYGKLFPVELDQSDTVSFFFDDNAYLNSFQPEENIVCPYEAKNHNLVHPKELIEKRRLIPVDTIDAISDENYYIDFVNNVLDPQEEVKHAIHF